MIPKIEKVLNKIEKEEQDKLKPQGKSFLFDYEKRKFEVLSGKITEIKEKEALEQWIKHCILTSYESCKVYENTGFGMGIKSLIGYRDMETFYKATLRQMIPEALLINRLINNVNVTDIELNGNKMTVYIDVESVYGEFKVVVDG